MISKELVTQLEHLRAPIFKAEEGDYAELVNEDDENGPVNICRKDGTPIMQMPREVYEQLRSTVSEDDQRRQRIARSRVSGTCDCGGEIETTSAHERDSSNDNHRCTRCGWHYGEMEAWES